MANAFNDSLRILAVDDEPLVLDLYKAILHSESITFSALGSD